MSELKQKKERLVDFCSNKNSKEETGEMKREREKTSSHAWRVPVVCKLGFRWGWTQKERERERRAGESKREHTHSGLGRRVDFSRDWTQLSGRGELTCTFITGLSQPKAVCRHRASDGWSAGIVSLSLSFSCSPSVKRSCCNLLHCSLHICSRCKAPPLLPFRWPLNSIFAPSAPVSTRSQ